MPPLGPTLETERLILRPPGEEGFDGYAALYADEQAAQYIGGQKDRAQAWRGFAALIGMWHLRSYGFFFVYEKQSGDWVGSIGPHFPEGWPGREVGWSIARTHWHKGYGKEATKAALDFAFNTLNWDQVIHVIDPQNTASAALARTLGSTIVRQIDELAGFGPMKLDIWGQSATDWRKRR
jgi:RimJ/RimL family protein N-acetyltransferase